MKLTIIRGLPGSGKTTMAKEICAETGAKHFEADMFFTDADGKYHFLPTELGRAHAWCQTQADLALQSGDVVVSNTFTRRWEMEPYLDVAKKHGADIEVIAATGNWKNIHGVPVGAIERMRERWED